MLPYVVADDLLQSLPPIGAHPAHRIGDDAAEQQTNQPTEQPHLHGIEPGIPEGQSVGHNHVRMGEQLQHLGHVARVDLRAGRKDQDPVATRVLERAAQRRPLAVPPAQHDQREGFARLLERHQPGQRLARIPTEHIEKLDLILCAIEGGPVRTMHLGQTAVVTQHGDNHGDDMDCPPLAGRRRRRP